MSQDIWKPGDPVDENTVVLGAVFRDFYQNHWPKDWYHDDCPIPVEDWDGTWVLPDDAVVALRDLGYCVWQGETGGDYRSGEMFPVSKIFAEWARAAPKEEVLVVAVPPGAAEDLKAYIETLGGRMVGPGVVKPAATEAPSP